MVIMPAILNLIRNTRIILKKERNDKVVMIITSRKGRKI
jgi:hypothetical protein